MNAPEYLIKVVDELLKKNEKLADTGEITHFAMLGKKRIAAGAYLRLRRRKCLQAQRFAQSSR